MALPNDQLFLDRFIAFNTNRYKDEQRIVDVLNSLTLGNTVFSNFRKVTLEGGEVRRLVDVDRVNILTGDSQEYTAADFIENHVSVLVKEETVTLTEAALITEPGIYRLSDAGAPDSNGVVMVPYGTNASGNLQDVVRSLIEANCKYSLLDADISLDGSLDFVLIDSRTIVGNLWVVECKVNEFIHDGTYFHDGTMTYQ